jgi:prepilin-type N-terminal cleavage/methylation domain-containing protein
MLSKTNKRQNGFTIIEVLIVLAIAGLIMLIVFLAVPALQRNARNTQRRNDVAAILGGTSEFVNNNNGSLPTGFDSSTSKVTGAVGTNSAPVKLGYYTPGNVSFGASAPTDTDHVVVATGYTCNATGTGLGSANTRGIVALYMAEPNANLCQGS